MARPRKVKPEDSLRPREGEAPPKPGSYLARRARAAMRAEESRRLNPDETRAGMAFSEEHLRTLSCIAAGLPIRGAREAIAAMRLMADFLLTKPATLVDHRVGISVVNPYAEAPEDLAALSLPSAGQAPALAPPEDED